MLETSQMAHLAETEGFSQPSPDMAMEYSSLVTKWGEVSGHMEAHIIGSVEVWINLIVQSVPSQ